jgi:hypothetical protein
LEKTNSGNISHLQTTTETTQDNTTKGKIILTSHKYSETPNDEVFDELPGQVKNIGKGTTEDISIIFTYYDVGSFSFITLFCLLYQACRLHISHLSF